MGLEDQSDEELVAEARRRGIEGAEAMSRAELLRVLLRTRPSFSPRSLLSRVVETFRSLRSDPPPPMSTPTAKPPPADDVVASEPIRTRTMAGLLAAQGHDERALAIYDDLLARGSTDPDVAREADAIRRRATRAEPPSEPIVALQVRGRSVLVAWQLPADARRRAVELAGAEGPTTAKAVIVAPDLEQVVRVEVLEKVVDDVGDWLLDDLPFGARVTVAVGVRPENRFVSAAHTQVVTLDAAATS
jgi:hypothetical protein